MRGAGVWGWEEGIRRVLTWLWGTWDFSLPVRSEIILVPSPLCRHTMVFQVP